MNRRGFLRSIGLAAAAFTVLPAATTYARRWAKSGPLYVVNSAWRSADYEITFIYYSGDWMWIPDNTQISEWKAAGYSLFRFNADGKIISPIIKA